MFKIKVPTDESGCVQCNMFSCAAMQGGQRERTGLPKDIHIDTLSKYLSNNLVRVLVSPSRIWSNASSTASSSSWLAKRWKQAPRHAAEELDKFDDDVNDVVDGDSTEY